MRAIANGIRLGCVLKALEPIIKKQDRLCPTALKTIKFTAEDGTLLLEATNLTVGQRIELDAEVLEPGEFLLPVEKHTVSHIASLVGQLTIASGERIEFKRDQGNHWSYPNQIAVEEFPVVTYEVGSELLNLTGKRLLELIAFVDGIYDETREGLQSAYFLFSERALDVVATDGHRLHWLEVPVYAEAGCHKLAIHRLAMPFLKRFAAAHKKDYIQISATDKKVYFRADKDLCVVENRETSLPTVWTDYVRIGGHSELVAKTADLVELAKLARRYKLTLNFSAGSVEAVIGGFFGSDDGITKQIILTTPPMEPFTVVLEGDYFHDAVTRLTGEHTYIYPHEEDPAHMNIIFVSEDATMTVMPRTN